MKPYYEHAGITIYHGDCREILPQLGKFDAVVTDPPYGINADQRQACRAGKRHGRAAAPSRDYGCTEGWDARPPDAELLDLVMKAGRRAIIWGGNYFALPPSRAWLVWDKENGANGYADAELAWTNLDQSLRLMRHRWMGMPAGAVGRRRYSGSPNAEAGSGNEVVPRLSAGGAHSD